MVGVGARLVAYDPASRVVTRLEHAAWPLLDRLGLDLALGDRLSTADGARLGELMAAEIVATLTSQRRATVPTLATDGGSVPAPTELRHLVVSGGVAEFLTGTPPAGFGDLGADLGAALHRRLAAAGLADRLRTDSQRIRATVVGASQFTNSAPLRASSSGDTVVTKSGEWWTDRLSLAAQQARPPERGRKVRWWRGGRA